MANPLAEEAKRVMVPGARVDIDVSAMGQYPVDSYTCDVLHVTATTARVQPCPTLELAPGESFPERTVYFTRVLSAVVWS